MTVLSKLTQRGLTPQQVFGTGFEDWSRGNSAAGMSVTQDTARKLVAIWACQRLLTNSISTMPVHVLRKVGDKRVPVTDPTWMREPTENPNDTFVDHVADVVMSLVSDGNAFIRALHSVAMAEYLYVLMPQSIKVDSSRMPYVSRELGAMGWNDIVHITLARNPGAGKRGLSPVDAAADTIGLGLAAQEFASRYFANGTVLSGIIETPPGMAMTDDAKKSLRDAFENKHQGSRKSHALGVLTGGATFKELSGHPAQAQLLELRKFQVEDIARLYGIPPHMIGSQEPGAVAYASVEQRSIDYVTNAVQPLVVKIEQAYQRLLPPDHYLKFNLSALLRGDVKTRWEAYQIALQSKAMTTDEIRAFEDLEPADDAKGVGTEHGGFLETPNNNPPDRNATNDGPAQVNSAPQNLEVHTHMPDVSLPSVNVPINVPSLDITTPPVMISDVHLAASAAAGLAERQDAQTAELTDRVDASAIEVVTHTQRVKAELSADLEAFKASMEAQFQAERDAREAEMSRLLAVPPKTMTVVQRDAHNRPLVVIEQRGDKTIRKLVTRDEFGQIESVTEVTEAA
jgi:HK97 family phage portal protein